MKSLVNKKKPKRNITEKENKSELHSFYQIKDQEQALEISVFINKFVVLDLSVITTILILLFLNWN